MTLARAEDPQSTLHLSKRKDAFMLCRTFFLKPEKCLNVEALCFSSQVSIVWPDKHTSVFEPEWLKRRCFSPAAREALQEELFYNGECSPGSSPSLCLWGQLSVCFPRDSFQSCQARQEGFLRLLWISSVASSIPLLDPTVSFCRLVISRL